MGTKQGCLCIYGQPGVELSSSHDSGAAVLQIFFLPGQGRIVALLEDNTLHLWQVCRLAQDDVDVFVMIIVSVSGNVLSAAGKVALHLRLGLFLHLWLARLHLLCMIVFLR